MTARSTQPAAGKSYHVNVLFGATEMPFVTLDSLPAVVRTLALSGAVVVVSHNERCQRLTFHRQKTRISREEPASKEAERDEKSVGDDPGEDDAQIGRPPAGIGRRPADSRPSPTASNSERVRRGDYEEEGGDRTSRGSLWTRSDGWWMAELSVPMHGDQSALLTIAREIAGPTLGPEGATFVVPPGEADAILTLLTGLFAQARRDGVLIDATVIEPHLVIEDGPAHE